MSECTCQYEQDTTMAEHAPECRLRTPEESFAMKYQQPGSTTLVLAAARAYQLDIAKIHTLWDVKAVLSVLATCRLWTDADYWGDPLKVKYFQPVIPVSDPQVP